MKVSYYSPELREVWDRFLDEVQSPFFFYKRDFIEYHKDRIVDASAMVWLNNKLVALIPCSRTDNSIIAHGGLTFGSFVLSDDRNSFFKQVFNAAVEFWRSEGASSFTYKKPPFFFKGENSQNDIYEMWRAGAQIIKRDLTTFVDLSCVIYSKGRKSSVKKAAKMDLSIVTGKSCLNEFYQLLTDVLIKRHSVKPVHSLDELNLLIDRFPTNIISSIVKLNGQTLAGVLLFDFGNVLHTQYLCSSEEGKRIGALDYLIDHHIKTVEENKSYFSFGISSESGGRFLNEGLILQKESFGGIDCCIDTYRMEL